MIEQTYTYSQIQKIILTHLYFSMGVSRMVHYDYKTLVIPQLKKKIKKIAKYEWIGQGEGKYNQIDIDHILREIKSDYKLFGDYKGLAQTVESINLLGSAIGGK